MDMTFLWGNWKEEGHFNVPVRKMDGKVWAGFVHLWVRTSGSSYKHGNKLHGYTMHQRHQTIYSPTNAHNVKNVELLKQSKIKEAAPTCFGLQGNHHQGATAST